MNLVMVPGEGEKRPAARVLGVDAHLDGVAVALDVVLPEGQLLTRGDADLPRHQVEPGHQLGHRVLHLQPGVHLQEVELAVLEEELDRPGVVVAAGLRHLDGGLAHGPAHLVGEGRSGALLHQLLVPPLGRAVALAQPQHVAVRVAEHLHLHVAGPAEIALDVDLRPPEVRLGFAGGRLHRLRRFGGGLHHLHAPPTAAVGGLDGQRPSDLVAEGDDLVG